MRLKLKGNTLLITSLFLVALSIFATGIMTYCVYSYKNNAKIVDSFNSKANLKNELSETYKKLIGNEKFSPLETKTIHDSIKDLEVDEEYSFNDNVYVHSFKAIEFGTTYDLLINDKNYKLSCALYFDTTLHIYSLGEVKIS